MYPKNKMCKTINYILSKSRPEKEDFCLSGSEIAFISDRNEDFSCPLYPLVKSLFGVVDVHILVYTDGSHSLTNYYVHRN